MRQIDDIRELALKGMTPVQVSELRGYPKHSVLSAYSRLRRRGVPVPGRRRGCETQRETIRRLAEQGWSAREIARQTGFKENSVSVTISILRREGETIPSLRKQRITIDLDPAVLSRLRSEARSRGVQPAEFTADLLRTVVRDELFNAIEG